MQDQSRRVNTKTETIISLAKELIEYLVRSRRGPRNGFVANINGTSGRNIEQKLRLNATVPGYYPTRLTPIKQQGKRHTLGRKESPRIQREARRRGSPRPPRSWRDIGTYYHLWMAICVAYHDYDREHIHRVPMALGRLRGDPVTHLPSCYGSGRGVPV